MWCYIAPYEASIIESIVAAISQRPRGVGLLLAVNFNAVLINLEGNMGDEEITAALATTGLDNMGTRFLL